jgi:hypothetical protein
VGNTVASLLGGASDVDASALQGIAITGVNANGKLWYSTNGGISWTENSTALSAGNALLLTADANNRVYFAPNAGFEGIVSDALSFRAWDQTSGTQGSFVSTTTNGTTTAFSSFIETVSQSVGRTLTIDTVSVDNLVAINEVIQLTGTAASNASVSLNINGTTRSVTADADGDWSYDMKLVPLVRYIMVRDVLDGSGAYTGTGVFDVSEVKAMQGANDLASGKPVFVSWSGTTVTSLTDNNSGSYVETGGTGE